MGGADGIASIILLTAWLAVVAAVLVRGGRRLKSALRATYEGVARLGPGLRERHHPRVQSLPPGIRGFWLLAIARFSRDEGEPKRLQVRARVEAAILLRDLVLLAVVAGAAVYWLR